MNATLCVRDFGPGNILKLIGQALNKKGAKAIEFYGDKENPVLDDDINLLILGMSSSEELAKEEVRVANEANKRNIYVVYVADSFGAWNRPWFHKSIVDSGRKANIFVINEDEAQLAKEKYPNAKVTVTGNPCWDKYFFPNYNKKSARLVLGIDSDSKIMLCPLGKDEGVNFSHALKAIEIASQIGVDQIIIGIHPGDKTPIGNYDKILLDSPISIRLVTKDQMSGDDLVNVADLVFESASTVGITSVCNPRRIPVVTWFSYAALERLKKSTGSDRWPLCEQKASFLYRDDADITVVQALLDGSLDGYQERLEHLYPKPARKGIALEKMIAAIESVAVLTH